MVVVRAVLGMVALWVGGLFPAGAFEGQARQGWVGRSGFEARVNCGVRCLYVLNAWLGRERSFEEVCKAFDVDPTAAEVSVAELVEAARRLGVDLMVRRMDAREAVKVRSAMIVLIPPAGEDGVGHFIVVRPVGSEEGTWQVLDPDATPMLTTPYSMFGQGELVVLLPRQGGGIGFVGGLGVLAAGCVFVLALRYVWRVLGVRLGLGDRGV